MNWVIFVFRCAKDPTVEFYDGILNNPLMSAFSVQAFGFVGEYDQVGKNIVKCVPEENKKHDTQNQTIIAIKL